MPETSVEGTVAMYVAEKAGGSVTGQLATTFIASPLLDVLGLGDSSAARYHAEVMEKLRMIGDSLGDMAKDLRASLDGIKGITSEIKNLITSDALADHLDKQDEQAQRIKKRFDTFANAVRYIATHHDDQGEISKAVNDVGRVLNEAEAISEAMDNLYNQIVPATSAHKSLLDYFLEAVRQMIFSYAEHGENYQFEMPEDFRFPTDIEYYECERVVMRGHQIALEQAKVIVPIFKRIIGTQTKGLMLLSLAWEKGPQTPQLVSHTNNVLELFTYLKSFYTNYVNAINQAVRDALKNNKKGVSGNLSREKKRIQNYGFTPRDSDTLQSSLVSELGSQGFDHIWTPSAKELEDWIFWKKLWSFSDPRDFSHFSHYQMLIFQPWKKRSEFRDPKTPRYCIMGDGATKDEIAVQLLPVEFRSSEKRKFQNEDGVWVEEGWDATRFEQYFHLIPFNAPPPKELTGILDRLPATKEETLVGSLDMLISKRIPVSIRCAEIPGAPMWLQGMESPQTDDLTFKFLQLSGEKTTTDDASNQWTVEKFESKDPRFKGLDTYHLQCLGLKKGNPSWLGGGLKRRVTYLTDTPSDPTRNTWFIRRGDNNLVSFYVSQQTNPNDDALDAGWLTAKEDGTISVAPWKTKGGYQMWSIFPYDET